MPQKPPLFFPLKSAAKPHRIAAMDCEGNGEPGCFVCAAVVSDAGRYTFTRKQDALDYIFSDELRDYWIFAHNLEYDLGTLTGGDLRPYKILFGPNGILWADLVGGDRHKWRLLDSTNILPGYSIEDLGQMVRKAKIELHPILQEHINAGRSLDLLDAADQNRILNYCLRDADILYEAVGQIQDELLSLGGELRPTVSGISLDIFRRKFMPKPWPIVPQEINNLARTAYYGARTEPFVLGRVSGVNGYDVSSLYPSVMREIQYPYPGYLTLEESPQNLGFILAKEGITQATVIVPDVDPPILPGRIKHHLFFPTGELSHAWPHNELRYALDNGCTLKSVDWSIFSSYTFSPFTDFIDALYSRRVLHASGSPIKEKFFKLLLNSAYGRFGINPEGGLLELVALDGDVDWNELRGAVLYWLNGWPYALREIHSDDAPPYANALISAYITAAGRIKMHGLIRANLDNLIYTDTDSLWMRGAIPTSSGIGQLRMVEENRDFWVTAPKEYAVFSGEHLIEAKAKGIPEAARLLFMEQGLAAFPSPVGLVEGLRRGLQPATWIERLRTKRYSLPKRSIVGPGPGTSEWLATRPWTWEELLLAFQMAEAHLPQEIEYLSS